MASPLEDVTDPLIRLLQPAVRLQATISSAVRDGNTVTGDLSEMEWDGVKAVVAAVVAAVVVVVVVSNTRAAKDLVEMYPGCRAIVGSSNAPAAFAALAASAAGVGWGWCGRNAGDA